MTPIKPFDSERSPLERFEVSTESFIVKVQVESGTADQPAPRWHGVIVHIASGNAFHFSNLHEIESVVIPYLQAHGLSFKEQNDSGQT
jgi:hypothetical protein